MTNNENCCLLWNIIQTNFLSQSGLKTRSDTKQSLDSLGNHIEAVIAQELLILSHPCTSDLGLATFGLALAWLGLALRAAEMYHSASPDAETSPTQASSPKLHCCTKIWIQTWLPRPPFTQLGVVFLRLSFCEKCREFAAVLKWGIGAPVWTDGKAGNGRSRDWTLLELRASFWFMEV